MWIDNEVGIEARAMSHLEMGILSDIKWLESIHQMYNKIKCCLQYN